jgi:hypothetical protein
VSQVPPDYVPDTDFSTLAATPILTLGLPGAQLDAEFAAIAETANDTIDRLSEIQRDDGQIRNGMVKVNALSADVLALITAAGANIRGSWETNTSYEVGDMVSVVAPQLIVTGYEDEGGPPSLSESMGGYFQGGSLNGKPLYLRDGGNEEQDRIYWFDNGITQRWLIDAGENAYYSEDSVASPDLVTTWKFYTGSDATELSVTVGANYSVYANPTYLAIEAHVSSVLFESDLRFWGLIAAPPSAGNLVSDSFSGDGTETTFTLSQDPLSKDNTQVYVDGVYIRKALYNISGSTLTFDAAPANATAIEVVIGVTVEAESVDIADNSVTTAKLVDGAVTEDKLADGSVTAVKLASGAAVPDDSISAAKLQNNSVTTDKVAAGSITEGKLASGSVSESKMATGAVTANKLGASAVTTAKVNDLAITAAKLATDAVETAKIKDENVTAAKLATDAVTNLKILAGTIEFDRLNSSSLAAGLLGLNGIPKVNVRFSGTSVVGTASNVAAITNTGTGKYRVDFTTALANANYIPQVSIASDRSAATYRTAAIEASADCTTTSCTISIRRADTGNLAVFAGSEFVMLTIF